MKLGVAKISIIEITRPKAPIPIAASAKMVKARFAEILRNFFGANLFAITDEKTAGNESNEAIAKKALLLDTNDAITSKIKNVDVMILSRPIKEKTNHKIVETPSTSQSVNLSIMWLLNDW